MKSLLDFNITENRALSADCHLLVLKPEQAELPELRPGQFVNVLVQDSPTTFLRRPISVNFADKAKNELWLMVKDAGAGTHAICNSAVGSKLNLLLPLGNGFSFPAGKDDRLLLIGGGVGIAPLLYFGYELMRLGYKPSFLLGGRKAADIYELDLFREIGEVFVTTEDGSLGVQGMVTGHPAIAEEYDHFYCCGPKPMMKAIARLAKERGIDCELSLENLMACGIGACLCCVEDTKDGHRCVCTDGPVFNIRDLNYDL